jgi:hypothetical protein
MIYKQVKTDDGETCYLAIDKMKSNIRLKGGSGSGNYNHAGRPGLVGGSGKPTRESLMANDMDAIDVILQSEDELEDWLKLKKDFDVDYNVFVQPDEGKASIYRVRLEGWFPDCMESRGEGKTCKTNITRDYKRIMETESGWKADISGYMKDFPGAEYGVTYIGERIE